MTDRPWFAECRVYEELAALLDLAGSRTAGLAVLQRLVERASSLTSAAGAGFVEVGRDSARMVAAAHALEWMRGRPISLSDPAILRLIDGPVVLEFEHTDLGPEEKYELAERGIHRLVRAAAVGDGSLAGFLILCYPQGTPPIPAERRSLVALLATYVGHLYTFGRGLPVDEQAGARPGVLLAGRAGDDRGLFIAVTSHELRTPVTVIRGYADTLMEHWDQLDEAKRRSAISVIGHRARDLARLLDRLLSAAGDGQTTPEQLVTAPFDLLEAVRDAVRELPADLRRDLRLGLPLELPKAMGDRSSIPTILTELITNARKYSPDVVDVELTAGSDARGVWVRVADRGIGISPEYVERAFERFWQSDTGDQRRSGGVGLGLYLVRRLTERQRGWASLRPRAGGGTVAEVRLPRADESPGEA